MKPKHLIIWWIVLIAALVVVLGWQPIKAGTLRIIGQVKRDSGLIAHWTFNQVDITGTTLADRGGKGYNGTLTGSPTVVTGIASEAMSVRGTDDYLRVTDNADLDIGTSDFTMSAWVYSFSDGANQAIVDKRTGIGGYEFLKRTTGGDSLALYVEGCGVVAQGGAVTGNLWHHAVVTRSGTAVTLYLDGGSSASGTCGSSLASTDDLAIGCTSPSTSCVEEWDGHIDEVRIYNRALSATDIEEIFRAGLRDFRPKTVAPPWNGLVGFWNFDECDSCTTAVDRSGNGNLGTMTNGASRTAAGKVGNAGSFDGSDDVVNYGNGASIRNLTSAYTLSAWVKPNGASEDGYIIGKTTGSIGSGYWIFWEGSTDTLSSASSILVVSDAIFTDNDTWVHITVAADGSTHQFYRNGVPAGSVSAGINAANDVDGGLGNRVGGGAAPDFNGSIDEVRIYNRALSAAEVKALYQDTRKFFTNVNQNKLINDDLVGFWPFNGPDVSGTTATDRGSGGNNGTLTNGPTVFPGVIGQALNFDGSNDYVNLGANASLDGILSSDFTMTGWAKSPVTGGTSQSIIQRGDGESAEQNKFFGIRYNTNNKLVGQVRGNNGEGATLTVTGGTTLPTDTWFHFALVRDIGVDGRVYINGVLDASAVADGAGSITFSATRSLGIGVAQLDSNVGSYYTGTIDEVRIYSRALSAAEISALYRAGRRE